MRPMGPSVKVTAGGHSHCHTFLYIDDMVARYITDVTRGSTLSTQTGKLWYQD